MVNVDFHGVAGNVVAPGINFIFNGFFGQDFVAVKQKEFQKSRFFGGQRDFPFVKKRFAGLRVERDFPVFDFRGADAAAAADQGVQAGLDFFKGKRFAEVIVGAVIQAGDPFVHVAARG